MTARGKSLAFAGLLRAINVAGSGKLTKDTLIALCEEAGFGDVSTYIQSGNVVFTTQLSEAKARTKLEKALTEQLGKPGHAALRSADELESLIAKNPYPEAPSNRVMVMFLGQAPTRADLMTVVAPDGEEVALAGRDLYIHYPNGLGRSRLKLPFAEHGTTRNMNTVSKLAKMVRELSG